MAVISLLLLLLSALSLSGAENNLTFVFGLPLNFRQHSTRAKLIITTTSTEDISYSVSINNAVLSTGYVNVQESGEFEIQRDYIVTDSSFSNRHKGIIVEASGNVSVIAYNSFVVHPHGASTGVLSVLPYKEVPALNEYRYFAVSVKNPEASSLMLLVGSVDNTEVSIKPSQNMSIPEYAQMDSNMTYVPNGTEHSVILHRGQTLLLKLDGEDLSGTEVISNRPLSVISGHECAQVPMEVGGCDQVLAQIPPTVMWGKDFALVPFAGRESGQMIKVVSAHGNTKLRHDCNQDNGDTSEITLLDEGETLEFNSSSYKACHLQSNQPIIVAQFSLGEDTDGFGDPAVMIVPPLKQYVRQVSFKTLTKQVAFPRQFVNIVVSANDFQPAQIQLDNKPILCDWSVLFAIDSSDILAYTCKLPVAANMSHVVTHTGSNGQLAVMAYGFNMRPRQGYAYTAAMAMLPLNAVIQVNFTMEVYQVNENNSFVTIELCRVDSVPSIARVMVFTVIGSALPGDDFSSIIQMVVFGIGEKTKTIMVPIHNDNWVEETEYFIVKLRPMGELSFPSQTTVEIIDDDDINIGFSLLDDDQSGSLKINTFRGKLEPGVPAKIQLKVEFVTSDMASYSYYINITQNHTNTTLPCSRCNQNNTALVGLLGLIDSERVNKSHITLYPSVTVLRPMVQSTSRTTTSPGAVVALPTLLIRPPSPFSSSASQNSLVYVGFASCICTIIVAIVVGVVGCFLSYKYGQNHGYRYNYIINKQTDPDLRMATETYVPIPSVNI